MRCSSLVLTAAVVIGGVLAGRSVVAQAAQNGTAPVVVGSLAAAPPAPPARLRPLFGGLSVAQATQLLGAARLNDVARSFASRAEASAFFARKGFEYLAENQPDTAAYRFNLAWLLNPQNADAYHGLAVLASASLATADAALPLLSQALVLAPADASILADLGTAYLNRYALSKKKKDLSAAAGFLQRALTADPNSAAAWQSTARVRYYQEDYAAAWEAVRKVQALNMTSLDFGFLTELMAKQPDPLGIFK